MKPNPNHDKAPGQGAQLQSVRFEFHHPTALSVCVAGSFNQWHASAKAMQPIGNGRWVRESTLAPGTYEYCLVVDGHWRPDPRALETVPNPFGGRNSVLKVAPLPQAAHHPAAQKAAVKHKHKHKHQNKKPARKL